MPLSEMILVVMGLLTVALMAAGLSRNAPLPFTVFLVIIGLMLGWFARHYPQLDFLLKFQLTPELVLFLFLPALIFESAFNLDARALIKELAPVLVLAIPALLLSTAIIGLGMWWLVDLELGIALLFGALISATDPVAVVALFKELGAPLRLTVLVEGESLLNDATAIVLFNVLLALVVSGNFAWGDVGSAAGNFLYVFLGGAIVGCVIGFLLSELLNYLRAGLNSLLIMSIVIAYVSFIVAEHFLHVSGVMAVVGAALVLGAFGIARMPEQATQTLKEVWEIIALICNSLLFLLVGLSVNIESLLAQSGIILLAVLVVTLARAATVYTLLPATARLLYLPRVTLGEQHIMWWGALKGGLAIAIVLTLPHTLADRDLVMNMTLGVVLFTLLVNAPTIRPLIHRLGIDRMTADEGAELKRELHLAENYAGRVLEEIAGAELLSGADLGDIRGNIHRIFAGEPEPADAAQQQRNLRLIALRAELEELKHLYRIGLIEQYTFLDIRNTLRMDREKLADHQSERASAAPRASLFVQLENAIVHWLREQNWATGLLVRYQNVCLAQRLQRDMAGVLLCKAVLEELKAQEDYPEAQREDVAAIYRERLARRQGRIRQIADEFPEFYRSYAARLSTLAALIAAREEIEHDLHHGEIGAKAYAH